MLAFRDVTKRREAEHRIQQLNEELERKVAERTAALHASNETAMRPYSGRTAVS